MTDKSATEAALPAETSETAGSPTNGERLRSHLKPASLAAALLCAWEAGDQTAPRRGCSPRCRISRRRDRINGSAPPQEDRYPGVPQLREADLISDDLTICCQIGTQAVAAGLALLMSYSARAENGTTAPVFKRDSVQGVTIRGDVLMADGMPDPGYQII